ncbi:2-dehydro-3-deoxygalactonokinase [Phaeobacter sp. C3_T13_0]|uniref:2-dehydro-3-deoxygalactonokinase n=1 Tax=Phaeobacter cretensis TaxID=3342641 RepID=UPI0039BCAD10
MCAASNLQSPASSAGLSRTKAARWIAADHSNGRLLVWLMNESDVLQRASQYSGSDPMADLARLVAELDDCPPETPILLNDDSLRGDDTGTITVPAKPADLPIGQTTLGTHPLRLLGGLSQSNPRVVMRGSVNRVAGFLSLNPDWDGVICIPGETTHWALISANEVVSFQSFLTTELWRSLARILGVNNAANFDVSDTSALTGSMETIQSKPEALAARLAELQASHSSKDATLAACLWGLLLGAELSAARPYWLGQNIALIAPPPLDAIYEAALTHQGVPLIRTDADRIALSGLISAWRGMAA